MIHVNRSRVPRPAILALKKGSPAYQELEKATEFFSKARGQQRFAFSVYKRPEVAKALAELFYGKCAYCEVSFAAAAPIDIEMFRPKGGVVESPKHPGYWWLAMVWANLLPSCPDCNRVRDHDGIKSGKANRFPLEDETKRAFKPRDEKKEKPLLLDPCVDFPEKHLVFDPNGMVVSDTRRGQETIKVLGLNRPALVKARAGAARRVAPIVARAEFVTKRIRGRGLEARQRMEEEVAKLDALCGPSEEFAALKRQLIKPAVDRILTTTRKRKKTASVDTPTPTITASRKRAATASYAQFEAVEASYSLKDEEGRKKYRGQRRLIESISIRNVRAIKKLDLDLTGSTTGRTSWMMLLGENATGKSTVLQATALALLGAESFVRLAKSRGLHPFKYVSYGRSSGKISVKLSGFPKPHTLVFRANRVEFTSPTGDKTTITFGTAEPQVNGSGWEPQTLLLGYGATRLLPRGSHEPGPSPPDEYSRVDNLFDPFVPLIDAEAWLLGLETEQFNDIAVVLRDLLPLPADAELVPEDKCIVVSAHGARVPLPDLSDGYQSIVAMTVDILQVALGIWPNLQEAEGTVLLDEIGAHLHPTWKMRVVSALRKALPAMQFLASTHDPLCLRGLGKGEVAVMRRGEDSQVVSLSDLPSPGDFRVDQLLTSDFFGLNSTVDPDVEAIFDEYYALLALKKPDEAQTKRLDILRESLKDRRHLGTTLRDNLMYEAVDRLVAQHRVLPALPMADLKQEAVEEVTKIWNEDAP
jgi:uncharacterized protein (TIGR02646 family)